MIGSRVGAFFGFLGRRDGVMDGGGSEAEPTRESGVPRNETPANATMEGLSHQFIYSIYAQGVSGVFVWVALILTCVQVHTHTHTHTPLSMM